MRPAILALLVCTAINQIHAWTRIEDAVSDTQL